MPNIVNFDLTTFRARVAAIAERGVLVGTSSWKYPGWCGLIYDEQRYLTRGKFSEAKFNRTCLADMPRFFGRCASMPATNSFRAPNTSGNSARRCRIDSASALK